MQLRLRSHHTTSLCTPTGLGATGSHPDSLVGRNLLLGYPARCLGLCCPGEVGMSPAVPDFHAMPGNLGGYDYGMLPSAFRRLGHLPVLCEEEVAAVAVGPSRKRSSP